MEQVNKKINAVAIDGPAGSGKSTISRMVAAKLGYTYIDTGAMYRAATLKVMQKNISMQDEEKIIECVEDINIKLTPSTEEGKTISVFLDSVDVTDEVRKMEVTVNIKHICKIPKVRENLVVLQKKMADISNGTVMEGRDIGTVVLPNAKHKIYLDADFNERVNRRLTELINKGQSITKEEVADDLSQRDHTDKTRKVGPLKQADDAIRVDTTGLTIDQVVDKIVALVKEG